MDVDAAEIMLIVAGIFAFLIVYAYRRDEESAVYKAMMVFGFIAGVGVLATCSVTSDTLAFFDMILIIVASFALIIRPFRDTEFAIIFAICAMVVVYIYLGDLSGDLSGLSEGIPRYVITFVAGAFVYMLLNFLQKIAQFFGKILNYWPILFVLGLICLVEGALLMSGGKTIYDYIQDYRNGELFVRFLLKY